jgi:hypothetical protein
VALSALRMKIDDVDGDRAGQDRDHEPDAPKQNEAG